MPLVVYVDTIEARRAVGLLQVPDDLFERHLPLRALDGGVWMLRLEVGKHGLAHIGEDERGLQRGRLQARSGNWYVAAPDLSWKYELQSYCTRERW